MGDARKWMALFMQHAGKRIWEVRTQKNDPKKGEVLIYGPIFPEKIFPWEVAPKELLEEIEALGDIDELWVHINSPGGDAFAGLTINNLLRRQKAKVIAQIDGLAASAASVIAMGADEIIMPANSLMMIHKAWTFTVGNADQLREEAAALDKLDAALVSTYMQHATVDRSEIEAMLSAGDTWLSPEEALDIGLATQIESDKAVAAALRGDKIIVNGVEWDASVFNTKPPLPEEPASPFGVEIKLPSEVIVSDFGKALADALGRQIKKDAPEPSEDELPPTAPEADTATDGAPQHGRSFYSRLVALNRNRHLQTAKELKIR